MAPKTRSKSINTGDQQVDYHIDQIKIKSENDFDNDDETFAQVFVMHENVCSSKCLTCSIQFKDDLELADHQKLMHRTQRPTCTKCKKSFVRKTHLRRHLLTTKSCQDSGDTAVDLGKFECKQCGSKFSRNDNLNQHLKKHCARNDSNLENNVCRKKKPYQCKKCLKMFQTPSHLLIHGRIHTRERPYSCDECPKSFTNSGALKKHHQTHTGEKPFKCAQCGSCFNLKGTLNRHQKIHTDIKPHKCKFCGKEFIQAGGLKAHLFFHTGQNGFECDQCDKRFNRKARLIMHQRFIHQKIKPHVCPDCGKSFTRKEDMNRHLVLHSGQRNHKCVHCDKTFAIKTSLTIHLLTHRKEEPIICQQCGRLFIRKDCLMRHIRKVHHTQLSTDLVKQEKMSVVEEKEKDASPNVGEDRNCHFELIDNKLNEQQLCEAIKELLILVVDHDLLKAYGWPEKPVDLLLESLTKQCNSPSPTDDQNLDFSDRLRANLKLLFTGVIEDKSLQDALNIKTVDALLVDIIQEAKQT